MIETTQHDDRSIIDVGWRDVPVLLASLLLELRRLRLDSDLGHPHQRRDRLPTYGAHLTGRIEGGVKHAKLAALR